MRIVVANLSAVYTGRGETSLPPYNRVVIIKSDGSVSIHSDAGFKPMNYMTALNDLEEHYNEVGEKVWVFQGKKKESLTVTFHQIHNEVDYELGNSDPGFSNKAGQESQLQEWLSQRIEIIGEGLNFVSREHQTGAGPVDLFAEGKDGTLVVIEVKRAAAMTSVSQVLRYVAAMKEKHPERKVDGVIAAVEFKGSTLSLAKKNDIKCVTVPADWLVSHESSTLAASETVNNFGAVGTLFEDSSVGI